MIQALRPGRSPLAVPIAIACLLAACGVLSRSPALPDGAKSREKSFDEVNRRWAGARARLALPIDVRKRAGDWTSSSAVYVGKDAGGEAFYFQLLVSERQTLNDLFDGSMLRPGTPFVAEGWRFKQPERGRGPYLELRFADRPARARVEFRGVRQFDFEAFPLSRLGQVEDYCRETLFKVSAPDALVPGPAATAPVPVPAGPQPASTPPAAATPPPAARATPAPVEQPVLELTRVSVTPNPVPRGGDAELLAIYSVGGLAPGASVVVLERREVLKGGQPILSTEDRFERSAATFTSSKPLRFSLEAAAGAYVLKVTLEAGGARVERTTRFDLR